MDRKERSDVVWEDQPRARRKIRDKRGWSIGTVATSAIGVIAIAGLFATRPRDAGSEFEGVPREIAGRWVTSDPRYADRMLVIERDNVALLLEMGPEGRERHPIAAVRGWETPSERGYRIRYGENEEYIVDVFVAPDGTLRLKNPPEVVWRRLPYVY